MKTLITMFFVAHPAHWSSFVFFVPVLAFFFWLAITQLRERRARGRADGAGGGDA